MENNTTPTTTATTTYSGDPGAEGIAAARAEFSRYCDQRIRCLMTRAAGRVARATYSGDPGAEGIAAAR